LHSAANNLKLVFVCTQRDRHVVTNLAAMLGNVSARRSESAAKSNDGSGVFDARRAASNYLRRALCHNGSVLVTTRRDQGLH